MYENHLSMTPTHCQVTPGGIFHHSHLCWSDNISSCDTQVCVHFSPLLSTSTNIALDIIDLYSEFNAHHGTNGQSGTPDHSLGTRCAPQWPLEGLGTLVWTKPIVTHCVALMGIVVMIQGVMEVKWCWHNKKPPRRTWMVKCSRALRLCALTRRLLMDYGFPSYPQYPYCTFHTWLFGWTTPHVTTYSTDFDSSEVCKTTDCTTFSWITGHLAGFPWGSFCQGSEPLRCFQLSQGKTCAFYLNNNQIVFYSLTEDVLS